MALPDYTTQDPATYKANIDSTAADHETRVGDLESKFVFLDEPVLILSTITVNTTDWTQLDMSAAYAAAFNAGATSAILNIYVVATAHTSAGQSNASAYLQKRGQGLVNTSTGSRVAVSVATVDGNWSSTDLTHSEVTINLDANSDFDYHFTGTNSAGGGGRSLAIWIKGYYV